jgi:hypothetical protein
MRDVPVLIGRIVFIFQPLLQLAMPPDLVRSDAGTHVAEDTRELLVFAKSARGRDYRSNKLRMIWWSMVGPITNPPCSGELLGPLRAGQFWIFDQSIYEELSRALHDGISRVSQELFVATIQVVIP